MSHFHVHLGVQNCTTISSNIALWSLWLSRGNIYVQGPSHSEVGFVSLFMRNCDFSPAKVRGNI